MAVDRTTSGFGARLRQAREQKGVSLRAIANATKISIRALEALERDNIAQLPGGIFSRAFVRAYAVEAGLDPEATVEDFVRQFPHDSVTAGHPPSTRIDDGDSIESDRRMASVVIRLLVLSVPIAAVLLYYGLANRTRPADPAAPSVAAAGKSEGPPPVASAEAGSRLSVELVASRASVISVAVDGQPSFDLQLENGGRRTVDAGREILLKVPDPASIAWSINGASGRPLGPPGEAATVLVTLDNYKDYLIAR